MNLFLPIAFESCLNRKLEGLLIGGVGVNMLILNPAQPLNGSISSQHRFRFALLKRLPREQHASHLRGGKWMSNRLLLFVECFAAPLSVLLHSIPIAPQARPIWCPITLFAGGCASPRALALGPGNGPTSLDSRWLDVLCSKILTSWRVLYKLNQIEDEFIARDVIILA